MLNIKTKTTYPTYNPIDIKKVFTNKMLYFAIGLFILEQLIIASIVINNHFFNNSFYGKLITILISGISILLSITLIQKPNKHFKPLSLLGIVIIMIGCSISTSIIYSSLFGQIPEQTNQQLLETIIQSNPFIMSLIVIIVTPIIEETIFRELLPKTLNQSVISFGIAAIIFVMVHTPNNTLGWLTYGGISIALTYIRLYQDNIYMCIGAHMLWNAFSITLYFITI